MFIQPVLVVALVAGIAQTTGCATTGPSGQAEINTWTGVSAKALYETYGTPSKSVEQDDGTTIVEFDYSRVASSTPYYCTVRYTVDAAGIVISGTYEGNIGGCNHLIKPYHTLP
jgi:hypothetical protein